MHWMYDIETDKKIILELEGGKENGYNQSKERRVLDIWMNNH